MKQLPEIFYLLGLICAVIGILLSVAILLKENPTLALALSLSVIGLVLGIVNLAAKKGGRG